MIYWYSNPGLEIEDRRQYEINGPAIDFIAKVTFSSD